MNKIIRDLCVLIAITMLSGCLTVKIDEQTAFAPLKRPFGPATTVAELDVRMAEWFSSAVTRGNLRLDPVANGGTKISFLSGGPYSRLGIAPPATVFRNAFIGESTGRIAITTYTAVGVDGVEQLTNRPLVVRCAGNAGDRYNSGRHDAANLLPWGDVLVFDYPGYGDTPGPTSAAAFEASSKTLTNYIESVSQNRKLVFWGHSLGGFVCSRLASTTKGVDGLVLETTAPNAAAVARAWTPVYARPFVRARVAPSLAGYDVVNAAAASGVPVLVLGATKDEVLPVALARQVADSLKSRNAPITYHEFPNADHMDVPYDPNFKAVAQTFFQVIESQP